MFDHQQLFFLLIPLLLASACNPDDEMEPKIIDNYEAGVYVVNRGSTDLPSSVDYYLEDCDQVVLDIYNQNNSNPLDSPLMDITFIGDKILLLHSNKLIIASSEKFEKLGEITGFTRAQQVNALNTQKAFITRYNTLGVGDGLLVVDLVNLTVIESTHPNRASEGMLRFGPALYIANSGGDLLDSTITKFDATSNLELLNIEVGKRPSQIVSDKNGHLWVMCLGLLVNPINPDDPENIEATLVKIENDVVTLEIPLGVRGGQLSIDKNKERLYFVSRGWTYDMSIDDNSLPPLPFAAQSFTASQIDPNTNLYYTSNARNFSGPGEVWVWDLSTMDTISSFEVGNIPLGFEFK